MVETRDPTIASLDAISMLAGPRTVEELSGGLTNRNLKVTTPTGTYVVRCSRSDTALLGIDRDAEHANSRSAELAGVGAPVLDYRPDLGMLVIGYIDGITYDNASFQRTGIVARAAAACRTLHSGPAFVAEFNMFDRQARYLAIVRERGFPLPPGYEEFNERFARMRTALDVRPDPLVPCNNDLLAGNFVDDGDKLWLIDYEYSGNNDACFELGNIGTECDLDTDQLDELVTEYYGRPLRGKFARTRLQAIASQYGWSLWGAIQDATSPLDFDFHAWSMERYERAAAAFSSNTFGILLEEAQRVD
ncbi:phosphotransferase [Solicola gregarius]|uniref:Choline kinase family protein n=1 Tax=Solicola gregarius TaxID=2908642 RepID=A0AA46TLK6_9ACTN|nr:phosphotransferase [Solicola gregarius]UYM07325.1 choline kinase family protein [Solicola gregarius]